MGWHFPLSLSITSGLNLSDLEAFMPVIISTFLKCHQGWVLRSHTGASPPERVQSLNQQPPMDVPETSALLDKVWKWCLPNQDDVPCSLCCHMRYLISHRRGWSWVWWVNGTKNLQTLVRNRRRNMSEMLNAEPTSHYCQILEGLTCRELRPYPTTTLLLRSYWWIYEL